MILPKIEHAEVKETAYGRIEIIMDSGWVFYDKENFSSLTDEEGNPREALPEEMIYSRYGVYAPETDFEHRIIVVEETEEIKNQIF